MGLRHGLRAGDWPSVIGRLEELVRSHCGEDAFEVVFSLLIAKLAAERLAGAPRWAADGSAVEPLLALARAAWPGISLFREDLPASAVAPAAAALAPLSLARGGKGALESLFEGVVSRTARAEKGQFFTPRTVVEACVKLADPRPGEAVLDPACGYGGFLLHAAHHAQGYGGTLALTGWDFDAQALRIARALLVIGGVEGGRLRRRDSLRPEPADGRYDVILTNPPFAGELQDPTLLEGYSLVRPGRRVERDALFLERCVGLLRPGGRLAIVVPHGKLGARRWSFLREWLLREARVQAVISLPGETFLPHTSQKAGIILASRRESPGAAPGEAARMAISARSGKDTRGRPLLRPGADPEGPPWETWDHDLAEALAGGAPVRIADLAPGAVLAPERYDPRRAPPSGVPLLALARLVSEPFSPAQGEDPSRYRVLDTRDAAEGLVVPRGELTAAAEIRSSKKRVRAGDVLVSRLRPYLRQVGYVDAALAADAPLLGSSEFMVLRALDGRSIAFLAPFLLSEPAQRVLCASQEGGQLPRFTAETLERLAVPAAWVDRRDALSAQVEAAAAAARSARESLASLAAAASEAAAGYGASDATTEDDHGREADG